MILDRIVEAKKQEIDRKKRIRPLAEVRKAAESASPPRDFRGAVSHSPCAIIAEVKKGSPSRGTIREGLDPLEIAAQYAGNGASAISVLTDEPFFGGHDSHLSAIRETVSLPLLRKDFIIDPYQIYETRALGADAVLLITRLLADSRLRDSVQTARALGLCALVEVHTREEVDRAVASEAGLIGINNRDLRTFVTDLATTLALAPLIPRDRTVVSESGIRSRNDVETLLAAGVGVFLVGETLVRAPDAGAKLKELLGEGD